MESRNFKNYGVDQQRLQIPELHFDKFPSPQMFSCWKIRFKTWGVLLFKFTTEAMLWIKEVKMVNSVDDQKSPCSIQRITPFPHFELLHTRTASSLNKTIQNSYFKKKVSLEEQKAQKADRFLRGRQIAYSIYDYFRVTGLDDSALDYADFFSVVLRNDNIEEFDTRWNDNLSSMEQFPPDDILESLYKLRIQTSEKLNTMVELYNVEIHQKKAKPHYHMLMKTQICGNPFTPTQCWIDWTANGMVAVLIACGFGRYRCGRWRVWVHGLNGSLDSIRSNMCAKTDHCLYGCNAAHGTIWDVVCWIPDDATDTLRCVDVWHCGLDSRRAGTTLWLCVHVESSGSSIQLHFDREKMSLHRSTFTW